MISGTITDLSGRTLSGQTGEAFWNSVRHADPLAVGLNCALGIDELKGHITELSRVAGVPVSCHPNAGLPNELGEYDEAPDAHGRRHGRSGRSRHLQPGWRVLRHDAGAHCGARPGGRRDRTSSGARTATKTRLSGPRADVDRRDVAAGERRRAHQRDRLGEVRQTHSWRRLRRGRNRRPRPGRERRTNHRREHGRRHARRGRSHDPLPEPHRDRARHQSGAGDDRFVEVACDRSRTQVCAGQVGRELDQPQRGRRTVPRASSTRPDVSARRSS